MRLSTLAGSTPCRNASMCLHRVQSNLAAPTSLQMCNGFLTARTCAISLRNAPADFYRPRVLSKAWQGCYPGFTASCPLPTRCSLTARCTQCTSQPAARGLWEGHSQAMGMEGKGQQESHWQRLPHLLWKHWVSHCFPLYLLLGFKGLIATLRVVSSDLCR